jgi:hypothetical protein
MCVTELTAELADAFPALIDVFLDLSDLLVLEVAETALELDVILDGFGFLDLHTQGIFFSVLDLVEREQRGLDRQPG